MARPSSHSEARLLDAAVELFASEGARGLTMSAVARASGAPSGSVYHRFPDRPTMLSRVWLRTQRRFQDGFVAAVGDGEPDGQTLIRVATWVVEWCRESFPEAAVLNTGVQAFKPGDWPEDARTELESLDRSAARKLTSVATSVGETESLRRDEAAYGLIDLPLSVAHRYLQAGQPPPPRAVSLTNRLARRLVGRRRA